MTVTQPDPTALFLYYEVNAYRIATDDASKNKIKQ